MDGSCRWYIKNNICLIGISKIQNIPGCEIPLSVKNIPIGEKRKPGRPAEAKQALIVHRNLVPSESRLNSINLLVLEKARKLNRRCFISF
ncbi:hypothetical protein BpHYR1_049317 [Brachionus plicatilis]|uniref:Uncharacterized protein n=1 Tax=Brachionus plicatilis TaxID=10195 RepID=A0A3M7SGA6_BRAPC|nr:hypothetical protein BpHYR1_049317 [Brachionus plicatilis]